MAIIMLVKPFKIIIVCGVYNVFVMMVLSTNGIHSTIYAPSKQRKNEQVADRVSEHIHNSLYHFRLP